MRQGRNRARPVRLAWVAALTLVGCTSVDSAAERQIAEQRLPRPAMIVVHDFAVSPRRGAVRRRLVEPETAPGYRQDRGREGRRPPAERAAAPDLPSGDVVTIEGRIVSLAGDPSEPGIVGFAGGWPDVVADVQLYGSDRSGERLSEDIEVSLSHGDHALPAAILPDPTIPAGQVATGRATVSPDEAAKLQTAARQAAATVAGQLEPFFAGQGWTHRAQS